MFQTIWMRFNRTRRNCISMRLRVRKIYVNEPRHANLDPYNFVWRCLFYCYCIVWRFSIWCTKSFCWRSTINKTTQIIFYSFMAYIDEPWERCGKIFPNYSAFLANSKYFRSNPFSFITYCYLFFSEVQTIWLIDIKPWSV